MPTLQKAGTQEWQISRKNHLYYFFSCSSHRRMVLLPPIGQVWDSCFSCGENQFPLIQFLPLTQTPWVPKQILQVVRSWGDSSYGTMEEQNPELIALAINKILQVFTMFFSTLDKLKIGRKVGGSGENWQFGVLQRKVVRPFFFLVSC